MELVLENSAGIILLPGDRLLCGQRACDTITSALCNQWANNTFKPNITSYTFPKGNPGRDLFISLIYFIYLLKFFIRISQALEIISLIFEVFAALRIIIVIVNVDGLQVELYLYQQYWV
ncbi:unnamed protein product [Rotaria sp. Silwood2]|nr:unnamed protein product [Rotaria sp. Silwood2]